MSRHALLRGVVLGASTGLALSTQAFAANEVASTASIEYIALGPSTNGQAAGIGTQNTILVTATANDWMAAQPTQLALPLRIEARVTTSKWRIRESWITIGYAPVDDGGLAHFDAANYAHHVEHGPGKDIKLNTFWVGQVGDSSLGVRARNACRILGQSLYAQGLSVEEIFSQDRATQMSLEFHYVARVGHKYDWNDVWEEDERSYAWRQSQPSYATVHIVCQKFKASEIVAGALPRPTVQDLAVGFQVTQVALALTPASHTGACPATVHLSPTIQANGKGVVRYRFKNQLGAASQVFQLAFSKADTKFPDHVISLGDSGAPQGLGFAAATGSGGDLGLAAPNDPDLVKGYFQVEVLSPHARKSNMASYTLRCKPGLIAGGGLVAATKPMVATLALADLVIEQAAPSGVASKLMVKVTNQGTAASKPTNLKLFYHAGGKVTVRGAVVPAVQPGQSQVVFAEAGASVAAADKILLRVDDPNRIAELNEGNNGFALQ